MAQEPCNQLTTFCPSYHRAVELIGRRWTGAILRALLADVCRFNELASAVPGLSDRMLAERLRELESERLVVRKVVPTSPVRVEYNLTEKGRALEAVVRALAGWAETWTDKHSRPPVGAPARVRAS